MGRAVHMTGFDVGQQADQPTTIQPPLLHDMLEKMFTACRNQGRHLLADRLELGDEFVEPRDLATDRLLEFGSIDDVKEQKRAIKCLRYGPILLELLKKSFLEFAASLGRDAVDGPHATARDALLRDSRDRTVLFQLADRVIERSDIHIEVALD